MYTFLRVGKNILRYGGIIVKINFCTNMKLKKNNNAITLIALVITIILLLILSGVVLNFILGNDNLIDKARTC